MFSYVQNVSLPIYKEQQIGKLKIEVCILSKMENKVPFMKNKQRRNINNTVYILPRKLVLIHAVHTI